MNNEANRRNTSRRPLPSADGDSGTVVKLPFPSPRKRSAAGGRAPLSVPEGPVPAEHAQRIGALDWTQASNRAYQAAMVSIDAIQDAVRRLTLEEVGYCRLFIAVTLAGEAAATWIRCLDAWEAFLRLDASALAN